MPSYQTFVLRLNRLEPTFQTFGMVLSDALAAERVPEFDHLVDSLSVMLAQHGHSYRARVGREVADIGYCAAKKTRFHLRHLHCIAQRRTHRLPLPSQVWLCSASHHDSKAFIEQQPEITADEKYYNRLVRAVRQPIESLSNWIEEKTGIHRASKVRSTDALMICKNQDMTLHNMASDNS